QEDRRSRFAARCDRQAARGDAPGRRGPRVRARGAASRQSPRARAARAADAMIVRGFYAVLDRDDERLARTLAAVACVLQVRIKPGAAIDITRVARMARRVCDELGAALVINDRVDIALAVGADGVHLGQDDLPLADARRIAGKLAIGVS